MAKNSPLVSVIVTTYNSNIKLLEKTIHSIVNQTYNNIQLIISDDCSNIETQEHLIKLQKQYGFQLLLAEKNSGSSSKPLNEGLKLAQGKYFALCAHDDYYLPEKIQIQVDFLEKHPQFAMVYSKNYTKNYGDNDEYIIKTLKHQSGNIFKELFLQKFYIPALTVMIKREVFNSIGGFDENLLIEDWDMWLRIAHAFPIGFIDDYLACYHIHSTNSSTLYTNRMLSDRKKIIEKWQSSRYYHAAAAVNRLLDGDSIRESFYALIKDTWVALINLKQPYRVARLFLSNIRRKYF